MTFYAVPEDPKRTHLCTSFGCLYAGVSFAVHTVQPQSPSEKFIPKCVAKTDVFKNENRAGDKAGERIRIEIRQASPTQYIPDFRLKNVFF